MDRKQPSNDERMQVQFWGVRGTLPVPGKKTVRYGGNTSCITLTVGKYFLIFDAGTGIKELSRFLVHENRFPLDAKIFISHPHYDHINGLPFFEPLYMAHNVFEIMGTTHGAMDIRALISGQMDSIYFPVTINEFMATLSFRNLGEETFFIGPLQVETFLLNHPGGCMGYRISYQNKAFCYIADNELYPEESVHFDAVYIERLKKFIHNAESVVIDTTYMDHEYEKKMGWGHSSVSHTMKLVHAANVQRVFLFHHDPAQMDREIDLKLKKARAYLKSYRSKTRCFAPHEGDRIYV